MRLTSFIFFAVAALMLVAPVAPVGSEAGRNAPTVDLGVLSLFHPGRVKVSFKEPVEVQLKDSYGVASYMTGKAFNIGLAKGGLSVNGEFAARFAGPDELLEFNIDIPGKFSRPYRGKLKISPSKSGSELVPVVMLLLEDLVAGSVLSELGGTSPEDAQRAQGVVTRSFILASKNLHGADFDICDTSHCTVFRGLENMPEQVRIRRMLESSKAVLRYNDRPVKAYFSAVCGGTTRTPREVWGRSEKYPYRPVTCNYCRGARHHKWSARISSENMARAMSLSPELEWGIQNSPDERIIITGTAPQRIFTREEFRIQLGRALGWNLLYSPWYTVRRDGGGYIFDGSGWGHGVGLCQAGAIEMAGRGKSWREILRFYYPGARLENQADM